MFKMIRALAWEQAKPVAGMMACVFPITCFFGFLQWAVSVSGLAAARWAYFDPDPLVAILIVMIACSGLCFGDQFLPWFPGRMYRLPVSAWFLSSVSLSVRIAMTLVWGGLLLALRYTVFASPVKVPFLSILILAAALGALVQAVLWCRHGGLIIAPLLLAAASVSL